MKNRNKKSKDKTLKYKPVVNY